MRPGDLHAVVLAPCVPGSYSEGREFAAFCPRILVLPYGQYVAPVSVEGCALVQPAEQSPLWPFDQLLAV